ncbi:hypothetical protein VQH23_26375 (plasmid) [Pararoseomonas sp. SCSIO 73927]
MSAGQRGKLALGVLLVLISALILSGLYKALETAMVDHASSWLTDLATRW